MCAPICPEPVNPTRVSSGDLTFLSHLAVPALLVVIWLPSICVIGKSPPELSSLDLIVLVIIDLVASAFCVHLLRLKSVYVLKEFIIVVGLFGLQAFHRSTIQSIWRLPGKCMSTFRIVFAGKGGRKGKAVWFVAANPMRKWEGGIHPAIKAIRGNDDQRPEHSPG